jgi:hypothetical protein
MVLKRRESDALNHDRSGVDKRLLITNKSNFTILEAYNKPWYSSPKDKAKKLGLIHKATLRLKED